VASGVVSIAPFLYRNVADALWQTLGRGRDSDSCKLGYSGELSGSIDDDNLELLVREGNAQAVKNCLISTRVNPDERDRVHTFRFFTALLDCRWNRGSMPHKRDLTNMHDSTRGGAHVEADGSSTLQIVIWLLQEESQAAKQVCSLSCRMEPHSCMW
jgi:hypothetical protein